MVQIVGIISVYNLWSVVLVHCIQYNSNRVSLFLYTVYQNIYTHIVASMATLSRQQSKGSGYLARTRSDGDYSYSL